LEDLLEDQQYYDAVLNSLPRVKAMNQAQQELANANQAIARECLEKDIARTKCQSESNLALSEQLYQLRTRTKETFEQAKNLEARQKVVEREQREIYSVSYPRLDTIK
jgi:ESCRT-I complex subunit VPS37